MTAAAILAVAWFAIHYSREARAYSDLLLLGLLSTSFWITILLRLNKGLRPSLSTSAGYVITAVLASYWHYFGLVLIGLQGLAMIVFVIQRRQALKLTIMLGAIVGLAYIPWLPTLLRDLFIPSHEVWLTPLQSLLVEGYGFVLIVFHKSRPLMVFALGSLGLYAYRRYRALTTIASKDLLTDLLLLLWWLLPLIIMYAKSALFSPTFSYRYLSISVPAAYLLLARMIVYLWQNPRNQALVTACVVAFLLADLIFLMRYYPSEQKEQFREVVREVVELSDTYADPLVIGLVYNAIPESTDYFDYYFQQENSALRVDLPGGRTSDIPNVAEAIHASNPRYIWFIRGHGKPEEAFMDYLVTHYHLIEHHQFHKADAWLFENTSRKTGQDS